MIKDRAHTSATARQLYQSLLKEGFDIVSRENYAKYRESTRAECKDEVESAITNFQGVIDDIKINGIGCLQLTPESWQTGKSPVILYAFGGGYVSGSSHEDLPLTTVIAGQSSAKIISVNYRLSPEHPFPVPQDDFAAVYPAVLEQFDHRRIALCGESAGGNQVLSLLLRLRSENKPLPACSVLLSPWLDLAHNGDSHDINDTRDPTLNTAWVEAAAEMHANGHPLDDPAISPVYGDMHDLPPLMITSGSRELLLSDSLRLAEKLRKTGGQCDLHIWEGMWHVFEYYPIPEAEQSLREVSEFIVSHCQA